ncbi:MAG: cytochrome C oxidase subunit I, partial [Aquabacterium sp.]|nr:cytochrome C oxidase subunit I [Ferruginibacter sp.]
MIMHIYLPRPTLYLFPVATMVSALLLFAWYCRKAFVQRIRKQVDDQLKISLLSVLMMVLPLIVLIITLILLVSGKDNSRMVLLYGFSIFFGWITAIIFGMTFKTLPFIIWNKVYHVKAGLGKTPNPKELFNSKIFAAMGIAYLTGFVLFAAGIIFFGMMVLKIAALLLLVAAILYNWNVFKIILHKPLKP